MRKRQRQRPEPVVVNDATEPETQELSVEAQARQAYVTAVRLLASRDHSVYEITRKLQQREHSADAIESALQELAELNYINDSRYAQLYAEQRLARGYGPYSVKSKLRERGVAAHLIDAALAGQQASWAELAQTALEKRFDVNTIVSRDQRDEARMSRFLQARGFSSSDALRALITARKSVR